ncbi:hypothetical protein FALCPG4_018796 [Fusarium falciforme]
MVTQAPIEEGRPVLETVVQQSILQQAQAAAANVATPKRQEALLQDINLITHEDDIPPPAYGDTYGEVRNEKDAPGTSACVTDDGRVSIRINQLNRRLSQIFTPVLRQPIQSVQDDHPTPPPTSPLPWEVKTEFLLLCHAGMLSALDKR